MRKFMATMACILLSLTVACSASPSGNEKVQLTIATTSARGAPVVTTSATPTSTVAYSGSISTPERMIVRNGSLTLVVDDIPATLDAITGLAATLQGYIVASNTWKNGEQIFGSVSLRVPAASFDTAMKAIAAMAVDVTAQNSSSQDVTQQYVDLNARLTNLQVTEQQLQTIMQQAQKVEDVLAVQAQLTDVRGQIEQIKGQMQYLEQTSATSLIQVNLEQAKLEAKFTGSGTSVKTGDEVLFQPDVAGGFTPYSFRWDFGDGGDSTDQSPVHVYQKTGKYTVSLVVSDDRGNTVTSSRQNYISVAQGGWSVGGVFSTAWQGLVSLGRIILSLAIGLLVFAPVWLVILLIIWLVRRRQKTAVRK